MVRVVDPDGTTAQLGAVEHHVVGPGIDMAQVAAGHFVQVLQLGGGEGMVHRHKPVLFFAPLVHGEVGDPQEVKGAGLDEVQLAGQMAAQGAQAVENHLVFAVGHQEEDIAGLCAQGGADGGFLLLGEEFLIGGGLGLSGRR